MVKIRVYELARELDMTNKDLVKKIRDMGIAVKAHMCSLDDESVARIKTEILSNKIEIGTSNKSIKMIKPVKSDLTGPTDIIARFKAKMLNKETKMAPEETRKKPSISDKRKKRASKTIEAFRKKYSKTQSDLFEAISANNRDQDDYLPEVINHVDDILNLIEQIKKYCDYSSPKKEHSPIQIPPYPKEMEKVLKTLAQDESSFRDFSSHIFQLIVEGHTEVMNDRAIISKSEFLGFASSLLGDIRLFRNNLHHLNITAYKRHKIGELYNKVCGKTVLDDPHSRMKFQLELLKRTAEVLEKELELVKQKINKLS